jgi:hypothetical protein
MVGKIALGPGLGCVARRPLGNQRVTAAAVNRLGTLASDQLEAERQSVARGTDDFHDAIPAVESKESAGRVPRVVPLANTIEPLRVTYGRHEP